MKANKNEGSMASNEARILKIEVNHINSALLRIEKKLDMLESDMKHRFDKIESSTSLGFRDLHNRLWSNFLWLMTMIIGLAGLLAHAQHWI